MATLCKLWDLNKNSYDQIQATTRFVILYRGFENFTRKTCIKSKMVTILYIYWLTMYRMEFTLMSRLDFTVKQTLSDALTKWFMLFLQNCETNQSQLDSIEFSCEFELVHLSFLITVSATVNIVSICFFSSADQPSHFIAQLLHLAYECNRINTYTSTHFCESVWKKKYCVDSFVWVYNFICRSR